MTATTGTTYQLRVAGHLDQHWSPVLAGLAIEHRPDGTSTLTGTVADQAQLHGVLTGLRDIGATLLALSSSEVPEARQALESVAWPLHTERLTIRRARPEDAETTWEYRRLEEVGRWLTEIPRDLDAYRATFVASSRLATTLVVERDGEVVGDLMLRVEDAWAQAEVTGAAAGSQAELGWVLDPARAGVGYATEAVRELLRACFEDLGLRRVVAVCFAENEASWRLMERLGLRRELHAVADALHRSGTWGDTYGYALLADEWRARTR